MLPIILNNLNIFGKIILININILLVQETKNELQYKLSKI